LTRNAERSDARAKSGGAGSAGAVPGPFVGEKGAIMTLEVIRNVFAWCALINLGILIIWALYLVLARDWLYGVHGKWFKISSEEFDKLHYGGIGLFKIGWILFNLVPYFALRIVG
jgi:hypothetical protein